MRAMKPLPSGLILVRNSVSFSLISGSVILFETPTKSRFGRNITYLPGRVTVVVSLAPLVPISSLVA